MVDKRFYKKKGPFSLKYLAGLVQGNIYGDETLIIEDAASLQHAKEKQISCFHNPKYLHQFQTTKAGACLIKEEDLSKTPKGLNLIIIPRPYRAFAKIAGTFYPEPEQFSDISEKACIHPSAKIGKHCCIEPYVVIRPHVVIANQCFIGSHTVIEEGVEIGEKVSIGSHVTISHALIGSNVCIKPGARIGQKGFGFDMDESGPIDIPQLGRVVIKDYVLIGSNTTIDRGSEPDTIIGEGVRIDNLVQIGHNVVIGDYSILVAQVGVAGSTKLGRFVVAAGQAGIAGHLNIGDKTRIGAQSGIMRDIQPNETVVGSPAMPVKEFFKQVAVLKKIIQDRR